MTRRCRAPLPPGGWPCWLAFVADDGAGLNVGSDVEQGFEVARAEASPPVRSKAMMSPEASDFAWILVMKPPRERPSACPSCPLLPRPPTHARARWLNRTSE